MVDIGIVGLDTSHGESFAAALADRTSANLAAVWDGGDVRSESYTREFCEQYDARRCTDPLDMLDAIDAVMILTVNWDTHRGLAVPFLENGVATMIDKPIAGRLGDVRAVEAAADEAPFFGGSAVPYHSAVRSFEPGRDDRALYCVGYDDPFYYGVHLVDTVCRIVDEDWATVSPATDPGQTADIVFVDGTYVTVRLDSPSDERRFAFLSIGNRTTAVEVGSSRADMDDMYRTYLDEFFDVIAGRSSASERVLNAAELLLGIHAALEHGRAITPDSRMLAEHEVGGRPFLEEYSPYY